MLVFEDLSFLPDSCEGLLLKFVEESKLDLVMLSLFDKVSLTLLSRVKRVMKYSREKVNSDFNSVSVGVQRLDESLKPDSHYYDKVRYMGMYSPLMFYLDRNIKRERNKAKILSFLD